MAGFLETNDSRVPSANETSDGSVTTGKLERGKEEQRKRGKEAKRRKEVIDKR